MYFVSFSTEISCASQNDWKRYFVYIHIQVHMINYYVLSCANENLKMIIIVIIVWNWEYIFTTVSLGQMSMSLVYLRRKWHLYRYLMSKQIVYRCKTLLSNYILNFSYKCLHYSTVDQRDALYYAVNWMFIITLSLLDTNLTH